MLAMTDWYKRRRGGAANRNKLKMPNQVRPPMAYKLGQRKTTKPSGKTNRPRWEKFESVLFVPFTPDSTLAKMLQAVEDNFAKVHN